MASKKELTDEEILDEVNEVVKEYFDRVRRIEEFLKRTFQEKWDSFEVETCKW